MSTPDTDRKTLEDAEQAVERKAAVQRPTRSRRRPMLYAIGTALIVLAGIGIYFGVTNMTRTVSVMATNTDVARGDTITVEDLKPIELSGGQNLDTIKAANAQDLVGTTALVDLPEGTLLTTKNVGEGLEVPSSSSIVGVTVTSAQMPAYPLAAGDKVRIVETPVNQGDPPIDTPKSFDAVVFTTTYNSEAKVWTVDLIVPKTLAPDIAARSATGRVALILDSAGQ